MATIGGLSGSTSNSVSMYGTSIKGYGGLASGLDTDSLIQGMTIGTRTKIQEALKKKQTYQWQMDAYRSISDKLISFSNKYLDITSTNSPYRASFFDKSVATAQGANSKYVSVSGAANALESMRVKGVKQLAKDASMVTKNESSDQILETGAVSSDVSRLNGGQFSITYDDYTYNFTLTQGQKIKYYEPDPTDPTKQIYKEMTADFSNTGSTVNTMNALFKSVDLQGLEEGDPKVSLGSKVSMGGWRDGDGDSIFSLNSLEPAADAKVLSYAGSNDTLKAFGFMDADDNLKGDGIINKAGETGTVVSDKADLHQDLADYLAGKSITFNYNGVKKAITFPTAKQIEDDPTIKDKFKDAASLATYLDGELEKAYGRGKVNVTESGGKLSFETEGSSILRISDADKGLMGTNGVLGIGYSTTNRVAMEESLANSGLKGLPDGFGAYKMNPDGTKHYLTAAENRGVETGLGTLYDTDGKLLININGKQVEGLTVDNSLSQVVSKINSSDAGIKLGYVETADLFSVTSTTRGEAGTIKFGTSNTDAPTDFLQSLFGKSYGTGIASTDYKKVDGKDARMEVEYAGGVTMEIKRDTNSFNLDGSTFTLNDKFGYTENADGTFTEIAGTEAISFTTAVNTDKITDVIKTMINDYNAVLEESFKQVKTKPDRDYGPLTDDEKSQLTTDEIKKLEDKAKEGILFNDGLTRSLSDQLRSVFTGVTDIGTLKNMGIMVSSDYTSNGKISFDEEKFKNALAEQPDKVKSLFTAPKDGDFKGGFTVRLKAITDGFASTRGAVKGSLIEKAGSTSVSNSVLMNAIKKQMDSLDDQVDTLKDKLQTEIDRYTRQFSSLEQLISQMNSQSSWLSQSMGG